MCCTRYVYITESQGGLQCWNEMISKIDAHWGKQPIFPINSQWLDTHSYSKFNMIRHCYETNDKIMKQNECRLP